MLGHYFYRRQHYSWLAADYYPYTRNPKSSNPLLIYQDLYQPWKDRDNFDKFIAQNRLAIRTGVWAQERAGVIDAVTAGRLRDICDLTDVVFFYPVVIRVDVSLIPASRRTIAGSGLSGSAECRIDDLRETEFDLLFLDFAADPDFERLVYDEYIGRTVTTASDALTILERRC